MKGLEKDMALLDIEVPAVEMNKEGMLRGGFCAVHVGGSGMIATQDTNILWCNKNHQCTINAVQGCGSTTPAPTTTTTATPTSASNDILFGASLMF